MKQQKSVFWDVGGDAWLERNSNALNSLNLPDDDSVLLEILKLPGLQNGSRLLEIGCSNGWRLNWLKHNTELTCYGLDPSASGVAEAQSNGLQVSRGTADQLPFDDQQFDVVVFGWCLFLVDRSDLFRVACEADRVLKDPGWLLILDFLNPDPITIPFHHHPGVFTYKMDYRKLFTWSPGYLEHSHKIAHRVTGEYTEDSYEWLATSVLRKNWENYLP